MIFSIIAGIGKNNELGKDNQLLWKLPADMKHFRETTSGHPVIMGRKTHESIGRPLPNRRNIVVTRDQDYVKDGIEVVHSIEEALALFENSDEEVFNIGGAQIYTEGITFADKLYITHVDATFDADTFFPSIGDSWQKISEEKYPADEQNEYPFSFATYIKKSQ